MKHLLWHLERLRHHRSVWRKLACSSDLSRPTHQQFCARLGLFCQKPGGTSLSHLPPGQGGTSAAGKPPHNHQADQVPTQPTAGM